MPYKLTRDVLVMGKGLRLRGGAVVSPSQFDPMLWGAWLGEGIVQEVVHESQLAELSLDELRVMGKEAGIVNAHLMRADTLRAKLIEVEVC